MRRSARLQLLYSRIAARDEFVLRRMTAQQSRVYARHKGPMLLKDAFASRRIAR
jgi:sigma54-dependent transcription regulator